MGDITTQQFNTNAQIVELTLSVLGNRSLHLQHSPMYPGVFLLG
jgi:hypothetical protein